MIDIDVAVEALSKYMQTDVVQGDTTLFKEYTHPETVVSRYLCKRLTDSLWLCGACGKGRITRTSTRCKVCKLKVSVIYYR